MDDLFRALPPLRANTSILPMFVRVGVVMRLTGLGRSTIYRLMA
jgi:predicted DNA-binding transcriptional regulator AlpA